MIPISAGRATKRRKLRRRTRTVKWTSALTAAALMVGIGTLSAQAETVYEIEGAWAGSTPAIVSKGDAVVSEWRFNINDDAPAPENNTIPDVTVEFTVHNGIFTEVPAVCLTEGVTPASAISTDGTMLTCNLGDRDQGTAELLLTGIQVTGNTGDKVTVTGTIGDKTATTPELDIENTFAMDMKWDQGNPVSTQNGTYQMLSFPWSLRHSPGGEPGPTSVTFRVTVTGGSVVVRPAANGGGCTEITSNQPGHPYSGTSGSSTDRAPFPTCTMTRVGSTNQFDIVISDIDYSKTVLPVKDSTGIDLPTDWDVVAAGMIHFRMTYSSPGTLNISANTPIYTSVSDVSVTDDPSNNTNAVGYARGYWTGGWVLDRLNPPMGGSPWTNTFRQIAGQPVLAKSGVIPPQSTGTTTELCHILDSKYVTFEWAQVGTISGGVVTPYAGTQPTLWYYTGTGTNNNLNPDHANYNPNGWQCNSSFSSSDWSTTPPADLSTVKALRVSIPYGLEVTTAAAELWVQSTIKPGVAVPQDIWTWTSYRIGTYWYHENRETAASQRPPGGTATPGLRYPFTGPGRDVLRVVGARPVIDKVVGQPETIPGATVDYTLKYRAEAVANTVLPEYTLVDVLPLNTTYVPGSATIAPTSITTLSDGRTELKWVFDDVSTNSDYYMHYKLVVSDEAEPGQIFTNTATASIGDQNASDSAGVRIREDGFTLITKTALQDTVPQVAGVAHGGWVVRLTSKDSVRQDFTDTIDVLPYVGDDRGTDFTGSYQLEGPIDVTNMPGATVYYTTADPSTISDDPKDPSNGAPNNVAGNTVGWSETFTPDATAVRVIGGQLPPSATQSFTINIVTTGASYEDVYVNRAQTVTNRTNLVMRTSDRFDIAATKSLTIKKYVQDAEGEWHDAQNIDDYPGFAQGASLNYRLVVTNTGDIPLQNVTITDDKVKLADLDPLPAGLGAGAVIAELLPGAENAVAIEYSVPLAGVAVGQTLINIACAAVPDDAEVEDSCDPAGVKVLPSSLAWTKIASGSEVRLAGSEWELTPVDSDGEPTGAAITVTDCIAPSAIECQDEIDRDNRAGEFLVTDLEAGRYMLVETIAPTGYVLDSTPRFIEVAGDTVIDEPIENEQQDALVIPLTGGTSADLFLIIGGLVAALTALVLVIRIRARRREDAQAVTW